MSARLSLLVVVLLGGGCDPVPTGFGGGGAMHRPPDRAVPEPPALRRLDNGHYRVRRPWTVRVSGETFRVPRGYTSNGITAPSSVKALLGDGVDRPETWAAVFHDWLFTVPGMSRQRADRLFHELLLAYGVSESKAKWMYSAVASYSARKEAR